jgi:hypothetical protein
MGQHDGPGVSTVSPAQSRSSLCTSRFTAATAAACLLPRLPDVSAALTIAERPQCAHGFPAGETVDG